LKNYSLGNLVETTILGKFFFLLGAFSLKKLFKDLFFGHTFCLWKKFKIKKSIKPKSRQITLVEREDLNHWITSFKKKKLFKEDN
jgi:hypothetical protein